MIVSKIVGGELQGTYPTLKQLVGKGFIVLFADVYKGVVVHSNEDAGYNKVGHFSDEWDEQQYSPYDGSVTLSNE